MPDPSQGEPKLDVWQEEEKSVPALALEVGMGPDGEPKVVGVKEVERKEKERFMLTRPKEYLKFCSNKDDHRFELVNSGKRDESGRVTIKCKNCPLGGIFRVGIDRLDSEGRLLS